MNDWTGGTERKRGSLQLVAMDELDSPTCTTEAIIGKLKERAIHVYPERDTEKITWGKRKRQVRRHGNQYKQIPHVSNRSLRGGAWTGLTRMRPDGVRGRGFPGRRKPRTHHSGSVSNPEHRSWTWFAVHHRHIPSLTPRVGTWPKKKMTVAQESVSSTHAICFHLNTVTWEINNRSII